MAQDLLGGGDRGRDEEEIKLPFDVRTFLLSLGRYRWGLAAILVVAVAAGAAAGTLLGKRTFQAETILRYVPLGVVKSASPLVTLQTELSQVKLAQNLAKVRLRLSLPTAIDSLGKAVEVTAGRDSALLIIRATWNTAEEAADIANTVRDVYLDGWIESQVAALDRLRSQTRAELKTLDTQAAALGAKIEELRGQITDEQSSPAASKGNLGFKFQQLRSAIVEDQAHRANMAELSKRELEMERAKSLRSQDLIPPSEFEKTAAAYKSQLAVSVDTGRIRALKNELEEVATSMSQGGGEASPTLGLLNTTLLRSFDLELQRVGIDEKVRELGGAIDQIREAADSHSAMEPGSTGAASPRNGAGGGAKKADPALLRNMLTTVLTTYGGEGGMFEIVSPADPPAAPLKSTRKLIAAGVSAGIFLLAFVLILLRILLRPIVRSAPEARLRLGMPVIGTLPYVSREALVLPWKPGAEMMEASRLLAERLRSIWPEKGTRILITGDAPGGGRSLVATHLAAALGLRGEKVLLVDADVRAPRDAHGLEFLSPGGGDSMLGVGDLLAGERPELSRIVVRTMLANVMLLPRGREIQAPEALRSKVMGDTLTEASKQADVVIVKAAPALPFVDAGMLAYWCDVVLFAVRAEHTRVPGVRRALERLKGSGARVRGAILLGVRRPFQDLD